jgi:hypothetical protein
MNLDEYYTTVEFNEQKFVLSKEWIRGKFYGYDKQDVLKRRVPANITDWDNAFENLSLKFEECNYRCNICKHFFTTNYNFSPTLDRIDNKLGHTLDNIKLSCVSCNLIKNNKDEEVTRLRIQFRNFAIKFNLPMVLTNEDTIKHLERCKYGGLSNIMHRFNEAEKII